ncbi:sigma-70 family RNA polymerase sigma factor [Chryseobacterium sp. ISL-6]|uniref:RNA polymerase sigma factor n=1 Tax=Chryseobacterium sp. ISL-6 TaxID=2819143 RepID=UPI001BEB08FA|nr:sigma-70 family RNA polymerase sigma factor [Chryseobacterium sp. ISL-6]
MTFFLKHINIEWGFYNEFYNRYKIPVFQYISRAIQNEDDVLDVMQNVFIHLWEYRDQLSNENLEHIIFHTIKQNVAQFYRKSKKQPFCSVKDIEYADNSFKELLEKETREQQLDAIEESLKLLPPARKEIFMMNKFDGVTQDQIAKQFNISKSAVENQISKAMLFLKKQHKTIKNS